MKWEQKFYGVILAIALIAGVGVITTDAQHVRVNGVSSGGFNGTSDTYASSTQATSGMFWNAGGWWDLKIAGNKVGNIHANGVYGGGDFGTSLQQNGLVLPGVAFVSLGTPGNGQITYCNNCTIANPCASGGTGALAKRLNGVWVCN